MQWLNHWQNLAPIPGLIYNSRDVEHVADKLAYLQPGNPAATFEWRILDDVREKIQKHYLNLDAIVGTEFQPDGMNGLKYRVEPLSPKSPKRLEDEPATHVLVFV